MENNGVGVRKGAWTKEEDILLKKCIEKYGEGKWHQVPLRAGLNRCRKSCRLRWLNYLRPNIKRGYFNRDEVDLIIRLHKLLGNRWSLIAGRLPGRTANDVKNFWNTHIEKNKTSTASTGREITEKAKTITESNILRPQPRTFSRSQVPGCPSTHQPTNSNDESPNDKQQPLLIQGQETNDRTTSSDECLRWWSNLLEMSTENEERTPFLFSRQDHLSDKEPIRSPRGFCDSNNYDQDQDGFGSLLLDVDVWTF